MTGGTGAAHLDTGRSKSASHRSIDSDWNRITVWSKHRHNNHFANSIFVKNYSNTISYIKITFI